MWSDAIRRHAVAMIALSSLLVSVNGLAIRTIESTNPWQLIFVRQSFFVPTLILILLLRYRKNIVPVFINIGLPGLFGGAAIALANVCMILAMTYTTVANTLFTLGACPLITAVLARIILKERLTPATLIATLVAMTGIGIMVSGGVMGGGVVGNLIALACALFFSLFVICLRIGKDRDMLPTSVIGAIFSVAIGAIGCQFDFHMSNQDLWLCFVWGGLLMTAVHTLFTLASRFVAGAEIMLISLIEFMLGPIWVWLVYSEAPGTTGLIGGALVLGAVTIRSVFLIHHQRIDSP